MNNTAITSREELIRDRDSLRVILYLAEYNPNIKIQALEDALGMSQDKLVPIIHRLRNNGIVSFNETKDTYELSPFGRNIVGNLRRL